MLPIQHAARALGVPDDQIRRLAKQGSIPGAVDRGGEWLIPTMSLVTVAKQQGWTLDLAALQHQLDEHALSRYSGDALAAQAAVLLAKTQATAARVESRDLLRRLREATTAAEADRAARAQAAQTLADLQRELEVARRNQAVAEARLTEVQTRVSSDDQQFQFMIDRIKSLEQERQRLSRSLGWLGRYRYRRLVERDLPRSSPFAVRSPGDQASLAAAVMHSPALEAPDQPVRGLADENDADITAASVDQWSATAMAPLPRRVPMTVPPVPINNASTVADAGDDIERVGNRVDDRVTEVDESGANGLAEPDNHSYPDDHPRRRYTQVPRTPDGRFDRSAPAASRSGFPLPTQ